MSGKNEENLTDRNQVKEMLQIMLQVTYASPPLVTQKTTFVYHV